VYNLTMSESGEKIQRSQEAPPDQREVREDLGPTGDPVLDATMQEIGETLGKGEGAVIVIGGITGDPAAPTDLSSDRIEYGEKIQQRFADVLLLPRREGGYPPDELKRISAENPGKVIIVDAPVFYDRLMTISPLLDTTVRGDGARESLRALMHSAVVKEGEVGGSDVAELKKTFGERFDEMRGEMASFGHLRMALPNNALSLALISLVYASKNQIEWDADSAESLLSKVSTSSDATLFLHIDNGEPSFWCNGEQIT